MPVNGGALKGCVLGTVPTRGFSTCPVPLHDHSQHATCNPCTVKCPICGWETTLAGYEFHVRHCRRLHEQRRAVENGGLREALRRQYPGGSYLLDREEQEETCYRVAPLVKMCSVSCARSLRSLDLTSAGLIAGPSGVPAWLAQHLMAKGS